MLDDYIDPAGLQIVDLGSWLTFNPVALPIEAAYSRLANKHPHLRVYRSEDLPPRFGLARHPRLARIVGLADEGWIVTTRERLAEREARRPWGGAHGFDAAFKSMHGLLVVSGPQLRSGLRVPPVENIHLYALMCELLGLQPSSHDGDASTFRGWLR